MGLLEDRKQAVHDNGLLEAKAVPLEQMLAAWSGLDLDPNEIRELAPVIAFTVVQALAAGMPVIGVAASMWWEGLATGLLLAEVRAKAAADA
jgi:hypothetical protein